MSSGRQNWAKNYEYEAGRIHAPQTLEEVQALVRGAGRAKALGTRHSFNDVADTPGDQISLERLDRIVHLDEANGTVTVEGGIPYGQLSEYLFERGYALHNLASLPHISVAGACATATHGSGDRNGNLATAVTGIEMVLADGSVRTYEKHRDGDLFNGVVVSLGALGVATKVTLQIHPAKPMAQRLYEGLDHETLFANFDAVTSSGYSVSLFTTWRKAAIEQVWIKDFCDGESLPAQDDFFGARPAPTHRHPIGDLSPVNCTEQMGVPGPWHERLPHFRMAFTPSSGEELQSEFLIPREHVVPALRVVASLSPRLTPLIQISEVRTMAADQLWMSPSYETPCVGIHFTWVKDWEAVRAVLPAIQEGLAPFHARPHWGKLFLTLSGGVDSLYRRAGDFRALCEELDPTGKFRNHYLERFTER